MPLDPEGRAAAAAPAARIAWRLAGDGDVAELAALNRQLAADEDHPDPLSPEALADRMALSLRTGYRAALFSRGGRTVAYALWAELADRLHLRHFFVARDARRRGVGRTCLSLLRREIWPPDKRLTVDVLAANRAARAFWRAVGYSEYSLTLELRPVPRGGAGGPPPPAADRDR